MAIWRRAKRKGWVVDSRAIGGTRKTVPTRQEALDLDAKQRVEAAQHPTPAGEAPQPPQYRDYTLKDYVEVFLARTLTEVSAATWRSYEQNLRCHIVPALGAIPVKALTIEVVAKFLWMKREARYGAPPGKPYGKNALRLMKAALSSLCTDLVQRDFVLDANPCLAVQSRKKRDQVTEEADSEPNPMSQDQLDAFLWQADQRVQANLLPYRLRIMWELRAKTGLRPSEAYALTTDSIDWTARELHVRQAVSYGKLKALKTKASKRNVHLSDGCVALLKDFVDYVTAEGTAQGQPSPHLLFPGRDGGLVQEEDERADRDHFHATRQAAHLPMFVPYDLRATFASTLAKAKVPILRIASQLGHTNAQMLLKHYGKDTDTETRYANVLDRPRKFFGTKENSGTKEIEEKEAEVVEEFGGPCRGRTYGPLIKSGRWPIFRTAQCCEGFPVYRSKSWACWLSIDSIASI